MGYNPASRPSCTSARCIDLPLVWASGGICIRRVCGGYKEYEGLQRVLYAQYARHEGTRGVYMRGTRSVKAISTYMGLKN